MRKATVNTELPETKDSRSSLTISAEYLLPRCGLANYLETLIEALQNMRPEDKIIVQSITPLWDESRTGTTLDTRFPERHLVSPGTREFIMTHIQPHLPKWMWNSILSGLSIYNFYGIHQSIAAWWKKQPRDTCALLPHIPLDPAVKPYYRALMKRRLIWVIHDLHPFYFPEAWNDHSLKMCKTILPQLAERAQQIIVHNNFTRDSAIRFLGADPAKMTVIRLPHILSLTAPQTTEDDEARLAELGVKKPFALWASSTTILHKNHNRLIRAWVEVQQQINTRVQLVCTGSKQPRWHEVSPLLESVGKQADILFTDTIPKESLQALIRHADLAVCPTLFEGGGCGPAMEAAYAGIPVVCSNIPQILEQYDQREDLCIFFDPTDESSMAQAAVSALLNPEQSRAMAERAKTWIQQRRTWEDVAREYWTVIRSVQKTGGSTPDNP